jgi:hypothetical protein
VLRPIGLGEYHGRGVSADQGVHAAIATLCRCLLRTTTNDNFALVLYFVEVIFLWGVITGSATGPAPPAPKTAQVPPTISDPRFARLELYLGGMAGYLL